MRGKKHHTHNSITFFFFKKKPKKHDCLVTLLFFTYLRSLRPLKNRKEKERKGWYYSLGTQSVDVRLEEKSAYRETSRPKTFTLSQSRATSTRLRVEKHMDR